jgi:putative membrane-bound dehydrogenase-like protein
MFRFADGNLTAELVASEPDVVAPVAIAWDADGRLFVAEMTDYPSGPVSGRIRMLEDRDRDGRYEHATVFADKIAFPNGVMPWNGGILVTAAPDILLFKDTDGDGRADERRVILSGFAEGNQQLRVNGLYWGLDNWIYGANGRSDGEVRWVAQASQPAGSGDFRVAHPETNVPSAQRGSRAADRRRTELEIFVNRQARKPAPQGAISIRRRDFRFRPDRQQFEAVAGHSQFGTAHDDWGNRFPVFNNIPIRHVVIEQRYLDRVPLLAGTETVVPISAPDDNGRVYYLAPPTLLIPQASDYFTSACGPSIYRGDALAAEYRGNFFVCEPVHNLIQRRRLLPQGASFNAERAEVGKDFLASTDPWFHPVFTATGPDGCLYVVDFYRKYVEHPAWVADELKTTVPWRTGEEHGRIWRIRPKNWIPTASKPNLGGTKSRDLVKYLGHSNGWWRDSAQRLIVERQDISVASALEKMVRKAPSALGRLHALYALDGLDALKPELVTGSLRDSNPRVREHAIRLAERFLKDEALTTHRENSDPARSRSDEMDRDRLLTSAPTKSSFGDSAPRWFVELKKAAFALAGDADPRVQFQLALSLGGFPDAEKADALAWLARTGAADRWQTLAILTSVGPRPWLFWKTLSGSTLIAAPTADQTPFVDKLAMLIGASAHEADLSEAAAWLTRREDAHFARLVLVDSLAEGAKTNPFLRQLIAKSTDASTDSRPMFDAFQLEARRAATSGAAPQHLRLAAARLLGKGQPHSAGPVLMDLLLSESPVQVRAAAVKSLTELNDVEVVAAAFSNWSRFHRDIRQQLLAGATRSQIMGAALLSALEQGKILLIEVDPATRQALQKVAQGELRQRAEALFKNAAAPDRERVVESFRPSIQLSGDRKHGAEIFARACLQCHAMQGEGNRVGPDLSGIAVQPRETMLMNILDPSRQVLPDFVSYTAVTTDGETVTGLITSESTASITLRRPNAPDATIERGRIKQLKADGKSLMPDGLEQGLAVQDMADLLSFLRQPDGALLPKDKPAASGLSGNMK